MIASGPEAWFAARTAGAPEALRQRAEHFFAHSAPSGLTERLANAGRAALSAATRDGGSRAAALDLLAADALITLALLASSERNPAGLALATSELRRQVTAVP